LCFPPPARLVTALISAARADAHPDTLPPHPHGSARPRRDLEPELLVLVNDDALLRHDDGSLPVFPAGVAPAGVVRIAEGQVVGAPDETFGIDAPLLGRGEGTVFS